MRRGQRGIALLVVLWACTLLAILVGGFASIARVEALQTRFTLGQQRARYAAEAGIMQAIVQVDAQRRRVMVADMHGEPTPGDILPGDGRPITLAFDGMHVAVGMADETGKVDLNTAEPRALKALFVAAGCTAGRADELTAHIVAWRGPTAGGVADDASPTAVASFSINGNGAARYAAFSAIEELQGLSGMDPDLYTRIEPAITIWSGQASPQPDFAHALAMAAVRGLDPTVAREVVAMRDSVPPGTVVPNLPGGIALGGALPGSAMTFHAVADDGHGARASVEATVQFPPATPERIPHQAMYTIVRWRDGPAVP